MSEEKRRSVIELPIFFHASRCYKWIHAYFPKIPKNQRYTLWQKCASVNLEILEALILSGYQKGEKRLQTLLKISTKLDLLKMLVRLAKDIKIINIKGYLSIQEILQQMGKMLGGWIKFATH